MRRSATELPADFNEYSPPKPRGVKVGAFAAWEVKDFLPVVCRLAGVKDGDSTFNAFFELGSERRSAIVQLPAEMLFREWRKPVAMVETR